MTIDWADPISQDLPEFSELFDVSLSASYCKLPKDFAEARELIANSQFQVFEGRSNEFESSLHGNIPNCDVEFQYLADRATIGRGAQVQLFDGIRKNLCLDPEFSIRLAIDLENELHNFLEISQLPFAELRVRIEQPLSSERLRSRVASCSHGRELATVSEIVRKMIDNPNLFHLDGRALCATKTYYGQSTLILPHDEIIARDYESLSVLQTLNCDNSLKQSFAWQILEELRSSDVSSTYEALINIICRQQVSPMICKPSGKVYTAENMNSLYFLGCCSTSPEDYGSGRAVLHARPIINQFGVRSNVPRLVMLISATEDARSDFTDLLNG